MMRAPAGSTRAPFCVSPCPSSSEFRVLACTKRDLTERSVRRTFLVIVDGGSVRGPLRQRVVLLLPASNWGQVAPLCPDGENVRVSVAGELEECNPLAQR